MKDNEIKSSIAPIICEGPDYGSVQIKMIGNPKKHAAYLGIEVVDPRITYSQRWHPIPDKDLRRLRNAIDKVLKPKDHP